MPRYFLSFGGENRAAARALAAGLKAAGVDLFFDEHISFTAEWMRKLENELTITDGFIALVGSGPIQGWSRAELDIATKRQIEHQAFRIIPFLLPAARLEDLPPFLQRFQIFQLSTG